jgi:tripartite-type tricarboxylate transporter receptor subunit TctC
MQFTQLARALLSASITVAAVAGVVTHTAWAQTDVAANYPSKPIRIIVGFAAGGGNDLLARIVGQKLAENIGQPVVVENKTGAGGRLAVEYAQGQPPDGYTLLVGATGQLAISSAIYPNLPFHPTKTLIPLTMIASYPLIIAVSMNDAIKSVKDLVAWGKANPAKSNYPTSSPAFTIPTELFKLKTGMPAQAVPYRSTNEMMLSIVGGQTLFGIADPSSTVPQVRAGKLRALAVNGAVRSNELPDVPTMAEVGLADVDIRLQWSGAFVIAGTPPAIVSKLESELRRVLADAGVRNKIKAISYDAGGGPGDEFARLIDADINVYWNVIKAANLKFE